MSNNVLIATVALLVRRDAMTILPVTVPAHELDIMKAVHGEENVTEAGGNAEPIGLDASSEVERLEQKYGSKALEDAYGAAYKKDIPKAMSAAAVQGGGSGLEAMSKAQLLEEAKARGVQADPSMNKAALVAAIQSAESGS